MDRESRLFAEQINTAILNLLEVELAPNTERDPWIEVDIDSVYVDGEPATERFR
jgi:hypothetical protein